MELSLAEPGPRAKAQDATDQILPGRKVHFASTLLSALRPKQWPKNLLVLAAPAAAAVLFKPSIAEHALLAMVLFCAASGATYLINDLVDKEADRAHQKKKSRPVASGRLPTKLAFGAAVALWALALGGSFAFGGGGLGVPVALYFLLNISYSAGLKHQPVVELLVVASGFVLRALAGAGATHVPVSSWFLAVASFGALFVVTGKRYAEQLNSAEDWSTQRRVLNSYSPAFLRSVLTLSATVTVTAYCLWAFEHAGPLARSAHSNTWLELSVLPVVAVVLYVLWLFDSGKAEAPEDLVFHDRLVQVLGVAWLGTLFIGLYV